VTVFCDGERRGPDPEGRGQGPDLKRSVRGRCARGLRAPATTSPPVRLLFCAIVLQGQAPYHKTSRARVCTGSVHCRAVELVHPSPSWMAGVWGEPSPRVPPEARPNLGPAVRVRETSQPGAQGRRGAGAQGREGTQGAQGAQGLCIVGCPSPFARTPRGWRGSGGRHLPRFPRRGREGARGGAKGREGVRRVTGAWAIIKGE